MKQSSNGAIIDSHFESLYPQDSRFNEIEKIITFIREGNSCQIISLSGVGRSILFGLLSYNSRVRIKHFGSDQKKFHFVLCNFSEIRKKPLIEAEKFLFLCLTDSLRDRNMQEEYQEISQVFKESISFNDELVLFAGLKKAIDLLVIKKNLNIIFMFNKFDEYLSMLDQGFFLNLKALRDRAKYNFSVIFSLNRPLEQLVDPTTLSDFYEFVAGHTIFLPLLDQPSLDFRLSYIEESTKRKLNNKIKNEIIKLTGGHIKMARICLEEILVNGKNLEGKSLLNFLLSNKAVRSVSYEIWGAFNPAEQEVLKKLVKGKTINANFTDFFENLSLISKNKIAIPLFEDFVKYRAEKKVLEKISYKEETKDIIKGELLLTDKLTSLEFRLLRFLLQNSDKILERNEIIDVVWQGDKSTAGVSDQALDQLIFRVRKKIEDDPDSPYHLQTIKGRGLRFIP